MDRRDKNQLAKIICYAAGCLIAYEIFLSLLPIIEMFLAIVGLGCLYHEYQKNKWRNRR